MERELNAHLGRKRYIGPEKCKPTATRRLEDLLLLHNNPALFQRFKKQLFQIADRYLDIKAVPRHQVDVWIAIETELLSTFPDIFGSDAPKAHLDLAMQIIAAHHYRKRYGFKNQQTQAMNSFPQDRRLVMSVSVLTTAAMRTIKKREQAMKREEDTIYITDDDDNHHENHKVEFTEPKLPQMTDISKPQPGPATIKIPSRTLSPIAGPSTLLSPPTPAKSQIISDYTESNSQAESPNADSNWGNPKDALGVIQVARFLNACFPSMPHLLKHFVNFGCVSEEYLLAVSTWPTEKISNFLNQVSGYGSKERKLSDMDMLVLQNHFISYFKKAQV